MKRDAHQPPPGVNLGFEDDCVTLPIDAILPLRTLGKNAKSSRKYRQIVASIAQIGIVEPPVVVPNPDKSATWLLLDGHLRIEALKDDGVQGLRSSPPDEGGELEDADGECVAGAEERAQSADCWAAV